MALVLLVVVAQGLTAQEARRVNIERGALAVAQGFYPNGLDSVDVAPEIVTWLGEELEEVGRGGAERAYCLFGRLTRIVPGLWITVDSIYRSPELYADSMSMTPLPCPPDAVGRAHLHTYQDDDDATSLFWSRRDAASFKTRVSIFGTVLYFDMIVGWTEAGPTWATWSWGELVEWEEQPGVEPFYVAPHEYIRTGLLRRFGVDIDTLYVEHE